MEADKSAPLTWGESRMPAPSASAAVESPGQERLHVGERRQTRECLAARMTARSSVEARNNLSLSVTLELQRRT